MLYCVIKNTTTVIDGSENPLEIMIQNAQNAGFTEAEVEILTEEEYLARVEAEPKPPQPPTEGERLEALELAMLDMVLGGA
jgi:hypothetical protein